MQYLYYVVLIHCSTVLHYEILYYPVLYCTISQYNIWYCNYCTNNTLYLNILYRTPEITLVIKYSFSAATSQYFYYILAYVIKVLGSSGMLESGKVWLPGCWAQPSPVQLSWGLRLPWFGLLVGFLLPVVCHIFAET